MHRHHATMPPQHTRATPTVVSTAQNAGDVNHAGGGGNGGGGGGGGGDGGGGDLATQDGALASRIEQALFAAHGRATTKAYRSRARQLSGALRSERGGALRKRLREGDLSADGLVASDLTEALLSDEDRRKRQDRKDKERRAIESLRIENMADVSDEYLCGRCGSRRCTLHNTNSMGAVHLTSVPDMIVNCLDCNHSFTLGG